jgi:hypothetical protein
MKERAKLFKFIENYRFDTKSITQDNYNYINDNNSLFQFLKTREINARMNFYNLVEFSNIMISLILFYVLCQYISINSFDPLILIFFDGSFIISAIIYSFIIKQKKGKKFSSSFFKYCLIAFLTSKFFFHDRLSLNSLFKIYVSKFY